MITEFSIQTFSAKYTYLQGEAIIGTFGAFLQCSERERVNLFWSGASPLSSLPHHIKVRTAQALPKTPKDLEREKERVMMGCEVEVEQQSSIARLPLFSVPPLMQSPERSGMVTPPLHASAAVPFRWEQEPGKPRPGTALVTFSNPTVTDFFPKCLELPPRLLIPSISPTTALDVNRFGSPSFRMSNDCYGSFNTERGILGAMVLTNKDKGWRFGSWRKNAFKVKRDVTGGSHVFPSSADRETGNAAAIGVGGTHNKVNMSNMKRSGSFSNLSHGKSRVWTTICEGLKQVVPWRSKKPKKDGSDLRL